MSILRKNKNSKNIFEATFESSDSDNNMTYK
jgi:hypothetical protein